MFECRACLLRSLRAIAGDTVNAQAITRGPKTLALTPRLVTPPIRRAASTAVRTNDTTPNSPFPNTRQNEGDAFDGTGANNQKGLAIKDEKALRTELKYLSDPLKLAEHVRYTLRCNKPEKALDLCRLASKQHEVIVSWNHCVDWYMSQGKVDQAIKIYNEMKKRAQFPDGYTYTLLLRGLAKPSRHGEVVKQANVVKAMSVYNSMKSPTSRVKPSIYHTNAALKVCSAALDMDALWGVAAKLPSKGKGAPDHMTYATLLTAIRHGAIGGVTGDVSPDQIAGRRQEAVNQGRRIWQEVIPKWRAGEVHIDEELVCAMGRLLLISKNMQDLDDVLSLVQQTMNIERQIASIGSAGRHTEHVPQETQASTSAEESTEDAEGYRDAPSTKAFHSVTALSHDSSKPGRASPLAYVRPGNPTLSMLIGACSALRTPKTANAYWDLLTTSNGPYNLQPDLPNFHAQFRLLGLNRSSARAVQVLKSMPDSGVFPTANTCRIVMSTCVRDKNNHNSLEHARAIIDEMEQHVVDPDVHVLLQYLNLASLSNDGPKIVAALKRLGPITHNLHSRNSRKTGEKDSDQADLRRQKEVLAFFQATVGVIDTLIKRNLVPKEDITHWQSRRSAITGLIGRMKDRVDLSAQDLDAHSTAVERGPAPLAGRDGKTTANTGARPRSTQPEQELKKLRWAERKGLRKEAGRQRAEGRKNWDAGQSRSSTSPRKFADTRMKLKT